MEGQKKAGRIWKTSDFGWHSCKQCGQKRLPYLPYLSHRSIWNVALPSINQYWFSGNVFFLPHILRVCCESIRITMTECSATGVSKQHGWNSKFESIISGITLMFFRFMLGPLGWHNLQAPANHCNQRQRAATVTKKILPGQCLPTPESAVSPSGFVSCFVFCFLLQFAKLFGLICQ